MITLGESELQLLAIAVAKIGFATGIVGAATWTAFSFICNAVAEFIDERYECKQRIANAQARNVHGPLILPGRSGLERRAIRAILRARASEQASVVGACDRHAGMVTG